MKTLALTLTLCAGLMAVQAAPTSGAEKSPQECVAGFKANLAAVAMPAEVKKFVDDFKGLNSAVGETSLAKMLTSPRTERDVYKVGLLTEESSNKLAPICAKFVADTMSAMQATGCPDIKALDGNEFGKYLEVISQDPEIDSVFGAAQLCIFV